MELGTLRVTAIGALTWPVMCTQTSRRAEILATRKLPSPGPMWQVTQLTLLCLEASQVAL